MFPPRGLFGTRCSTVAYFLPFLHPPFAFPTVFLTGALFFLVAAIVLLLPGSFASVHIVPQRTSKYNIWCSGRVFIECYIYYTSRARITRADEDIAALGA